MELERSKELLKSKGYGVAAISFDSVEILSNFSSRRNITIPLLSDPDSKIIKAFGILNDKVPPGPMAGIPHPGTFIIDETGRIKERYFEDDFRERYTVAGILKERVESGAADLPRLRLNWSASTTQVRGGQHILLTLDGTLPPKMHVYAPGVSQEYRPVKWTMNESPTWKTGEPAFPAAKKMSLAGDPELVPVYEGKFSITREFVLAREQDLKPRISAEGDFAVEGAIQFQASDDRMCFPPQTIPLKWTFHLEGHDGQRVPVELRRK